MKRVSGYARHRVRTVRFSRKSSRSYILVGRIDCLKCHPRTYPKLKQTGLAEGRSTDDLGCPLNLEGVRPGTFQTGFTCYVLLIYGLPMQGGLYKVYTVLSEKARCARDAVLSGDPASLFPRDAKRTAELGLPIYSL